MCFDGTSNFWVMGKGIHESFRRGRWGGWAWGTCRSHPGSHGTWWRTPNPWPRGRGSSYPCSSPPAPQPSATQPPEAPKAHGTPAAPSNLSSWAAPTGCWSASSAVRTAYNSSCASLHYWPLSQSWRSTALRWCLPAALRWRSPPPPPMAPSWRSSPWFKPSTQTKPARSKEIQVLLPLSTYNQFLE